MSLEACYRMMWIALRGMSLLMGGLSLVALFLSFFIPEQGAYAIVWLVGASIIALGLPPLEPQAPRRGQSYSKGRQLFMKVSRRSSIIRRLSELARW
jgi:hypothetical protein